MFGSKFNTAKCETTCRLCVGRIKLGRNKKQLQLKQMQKDIAEQLRNGKQEYARIRVEGVIREKLLLQAYEILELYLELLTVRTQLISKTKELPRDMMEAVSSIIYAAQRINDLPELSTLRQLFAQKYGKEYAMEAAADATTGKWAVNGNLIRCLLVEAPQPEEKLAALSDIAQEYGVEWDLSAAARDMGVGTGGSAALHAAHAEAPGLVHPPSGAVGGAPSYSSGGGGHMGGGHMGGGGGGGAPVYMMPGQQPQYNDAHQAAHAAAAAAAQARAAADYAAAVAAEMGAAPAPQLAPPAMPQGAPPPQGWLVQHPGAEAVVGAPSSAASSVTSQMAPHGGPAPHLPPVTGLDGFHSGAPGGAHPPHLPSEHSAGSAGSGGGAPAPPGGFVVRTNEEIQRAYDAALGPPTKGGVAPMAPSAPPPPPAAPALPPSPPPVPAAAEDEYDELTRRLEALKRS